MCVPWPRSPEEGIGIFEAGVVQGCGYLEVNQGPLQEQQVALTTVQSLQP